MAQKEIPKEFKDALDDARHCVKMKPSEMTVEDMVARRDRLKQALEDNRADLTPKLIKEAEYSITIIERHIKERQGLGALRVDKSGLGSKVFVKTQPVEAPPRLEDTGWVRDADAKVPQPPPAVRGALGKDNAAKLYEDMPKYFNNDSNIGTVLTGYMSGKTDAQWAEMLFGTGNVPSDAVSQVRALLNDNKIAEAINFANEKGFGKGGLITFIEGQLEGMTRTITVPNQMYNFRVGGKLFSYEDPDQMEKRIAALTSAYVGAAWMPKFVNSTVAQTKFVKENGQWAEKITSKDSETVFKNYTEFYGGYGLKLGVPMGIELGGVLGDDKKFRFGYGTLFLGKPADPLGGKKAPALTALTIDFRNLHAYNLDIPEGTYDLTTTVQVTVPAGKTAFVFLPQLNLVGDFKDKDNMEIGGGGLVRFQIGRNHDVLTVTLEGGYLTNAPLTGNEKESKRGHVVPIGVNWADVMGVRYNIPVSGKGAPGTLNVFFDPFELVRKLSK